MCGICGIVNSDSRAIDTSELTRMRETMRHRGPDDAGMFVDKNAGLGNRRLSIIDLEGSHQPMCNEDGTIWLSYNGEIYNYKEISESLSKKGHRLRTKGDAEVIVHLYEEYGEELCQKLNGMFAIALWDKREKKLFLARDRLGIKPLYYARTKEAFLFASEIKAIIAHSGFVPRVNVERIGDFLGFGSVLGQETLFEGIYEVPPGHWLTLKDDHTAVSKYWDVDLEKGEKRSTSYYTETLDRMLTESVRVRLVSDVPVGALLSGGIDSSLVVYNMCRLNGGVRTFTVGLSEKGYDESEFARAVSKKFGTEHYQVMLNSQDFFDALPRLIWHNDEPILHPSAVPIYLVARLARENGVKVLLSGEGGDELFSGYSHYPAYVRDMRLRKFLPRFAAYPILFLLSPMVRSKIGGIAKRRTFSAEDLLKFHTSPHFRMAERLVDTESHDSSFFTTVCADLSGVDPLSVLSYCQLKTGLVTLLLRQDKMSMAASVESRVPYLDHRLVEFASRIPAELKLSGRTGKVILREIGSHVLPRETIERQKMGFPLPLREWLRNDCSTQILREANRPYLRRKEMLRILDEHRRGEDDHAAMIWNLLNLELWTRIFMEKEGH